MEHYNAQLRHYLYFFLEPFFPETYAAQSFADFEKNKSDIQLTRTPFVLGGSKMRGGALISIDGTIYCKVNDHTAILEERTKENNSLVVDLHFLSAEKFKTLRQAEFVKNIELLYKPKENLVALLDYE